MHMVNSQKQKHAFLEQRKQAKLQKKSDKMSKMVSAIALYCALYCALYWELYCASFFFMSTFLLGTFDFEQTEVYAMKKKALTQKQLHEKDAPRPSKASKVKGSH